MAAETVTERLTLLFREKMLKMLGADSKAMCDWIGPMFPLLRGEVPDERLRKPSRLCHGMGTWSCDVFWKCP